MRILVTGSSGLVGGAVAGHLAAMGHDVVGLSRRHRPSGPERQRIEADLSSADCARILLTDTAPCEAIVHAAAAMDKQLHTVAIGLTNCAGTQQLLRVADEWKSRHFVFISGAAIIGTPCQHPITEDHPVHPASAYHASKFFGECLVRLAATSGMAGTTLRVTAPIGHPMPPERILPVFLRRALAGQPLLLAGQGTRRQDYVDVRDVARAAALCLQQRTGGLFNVGSGRAVSNRELAELCIQLAESRSTIAFTGTPDPEEGVVWDVSLERARSAFGYQPQFTLNQTLRELLDDLRDPAPPFR